MREPYYPSADSPKWSAVDTYFSDLLAPNDAVLGQSLKNNANAGLPSHDVSAVQGKFLALLINISSAKNVLEIGTLGGYSTIWMARALPANGRITTIERDPNCAKIARENFRFAGIEEKIDLRVGAAADVLPNLDAPFDLVFIDADKPNNPLYLEWALKLSRPGTVIVADNVVRGGEVADSNSANASVIGVRTYMELLAANPLIDSTALQTVGEKGWDGFAISVVGQNGM